MIVNVAAGRHDGKSSFKKLCHYISDGITQSGESTLKTSWDCLTQYITKESVLNALGDDVEKTIAVEIGNLESLKTAPHEMRAVAAKNARQKNPVYHYILSWPENERPTTEAIFAAARHSLKALGLYEHQYIVAIHANTDNLHAHVEVNRIHPKTFRAARLEWAHATLHKAARESELEFGWSHDKGIYEVVEINDAKHIVRKSASLHQDVLPVRGAANKFEVWSGEQSLESWCKGAPADALKTILQARQLSGWQDIHRVLTQYGLELRDSGGGLKVIDVSETEPPSGKAGKSVVVSASKAFRFLKRPMLEQRLGPFEAKTADINLNVPQLTYKRDPVKRLDRRLIRKALRDALHDRYQEQMTEIRTRREIASQELAKQFGSDDQARLQALAEQYSQQRSAIRDSTTLMPVQKQQAYMLAKLTMLKARAQLKLQIAEERAVRRTLLPAMLTWREWVEQQAQLGDEAAISALRGLIYQEKRNGEKPKELAKDENAILPVSMQDGDPYIRAIQNLSWKVARNGCVTYTFNTGEAGFIDEGIKLTFGRKDVSDQALMVSLRYAADKWNGELRLSGGDVVFKERVARMALGMGVSINNPEIKALQKQMTTKISSQDDNESIERMLRQRDEKADIQYAVTQSRRYAGLIVAEDKRYIAQDVGKHCYVLHEKAAFPKEAPSVGRTASIRYLSGSATVEPRIQPKRGRG